MHGYGEYDWNNGKKYFGFYKEDKRNGFGIQCQSDKISYIGFWKNGQKNGFGKYVKGKDIIYGIWKDGSKVKLFKNEEEFFENLKDKKIKYKSFFELSIKDIIKKFE